MRPARLITAIVALVLPVLSASAMAAASPANPKVGVIWTNTAFNGPWSGSLYTSRVNATIDVLKMGFTDVVKVQDAEVNSTNPAVLGKYDVLVAPRLTSMTLVQRQNLRDYVARGGGLVSSFQLGNWDAAGSSYVAYHQNQTWGVPTNFINSWRWGETSELRAVRFNNDPMMYEGYKIRSSANSHPILEQTKADLDLSSIVLEPGSREYNELVWGMPGTTGLTPMFTYDTRASAGTGDDGAHGTLAGWTHRYYLGRVVHYGFQLHDFAWPNPNSTPTRRASQRLFINSVKWAAQPYGFQRTTKTPQISASGRFSLGRLYINHSVKNAGSVQMNGTMGVTFINPSGKTVAAYGASSRGNVAIPAGGTYTLGSWQASLGTRPARGRWTARLTYRYYDYYRGGWVASQRDAYMNSNGTSMSWAGMAAQVNPKSNRTTIGSRLAGATRYDTAAALSASGRSQGAFAGRSVVIASGTGWQDAMAAAPLAGKLRAPVLLVPRTGVLPASVAAELRALFSNAASGTVYVVGGTSVVDGGIEAQVEAAIASVDASGADIAAQRIEGADFYARAAEVARIVGTPDSGAFADTAFVASGASFADALAVSPIAARHGVPILFAAGTTPGASTAGALRDLEVSHTVIAGGTGVVTADFETWLETNGHRAPGVAQNTADRDTRLAGATRYETARAALDLAVSGLGGFSTGNLYVATGLNYPDALAAGALGGPLGRPIALIDGNCISASPATAIYLYEQRPSPPSLTFVGGTGAVSDYVRGQVRVTLGL